MSSNSFKLEPGRTISHFRLEKLLGEGGMGAVYLAEDLTLSRRVAIKFMRRSMLATLPNPEVRKKVEQRFIREAKSAASINHPNIAQIYEANFETDHWYIAMEFIDGKPLDEILTKDGPMKAEKALDIISQVANGLEYAWDSYKIIHRDIKPQNLMFSKRGHIKIVDLGLAKPIIESGEEELELTGAGVPVGTPYYMAPEQAAGGTVNHQTDIFALGATVYELLSGKKCFQGKTPPMIYNKQINKDYLPLTEFGVDQAVSDLIDKMLEPNQSERVQNYDELINLVDNLKSGGVSDVDLDNMETIDGSLLNQTKMNTQTMYGTVITGAPTDDMKTMIDVFFPVDFKILDRYRILKVIGRGNSGIVYHCMDTQLERECSVKTVTSGREYSVQEFPRIKKNYIKMSGRKHKNLVEIHDVQVSTDGNEVYIIMELLKGKNLLQHTNSLSHINERVSIDSIAPILTKIAEALDSVSTEFHIIHNDLKPVSIFITDNDDIKILDYGITYLSQEDDPYIGDPEIWKFPISNPDYMSPELWQHKKPSMAADQYSLAVIIYEIISHKLPFWMKDLQSTIEQDEHYMLNLLNKQYERVINDPPEPIEHLEKHHNKALMKALSKSPQQRYPNCVSFITALTGRSASKNSPVIAAVAALVIAAGIGGYVLFSNNKNLEEQVGKISNDCQELVTKLASFTDLSQIEKKLSDAAAKSSQKDFIAAAEVYGEAHEDLKNLLKSKTEELNGKISAHKKEFDTISKNLKDLFSLQPDLKQKFELINFPSVSADSGLSALTTKVKQASEAVTSIKALEKDGMSRISRLKEDLQKEIAEVENKWQNVDGEKGTEESKKKFLEHLKKAKDALTKNQLGTARDSKMSAEETYDITLGIVNSRYTSDIDTKKTQLLKMREATKPILYFLENANIRYDALIEGDKLRDVAEKNKELKKVSTILTGQIESLQRLKTQLETTAKENYIRNINNKKTECIAIKNELDPYKDLLKNYTAVGEEFTKADTFLKNEQYLNARSSYDQLEAKLKGLQNDLNSELKSRVNDLHTKVVDLSSKLSNYKEINPDIGLKIDDFEINFQVVRAKKAENKFKSAYDEYKTLLDFGTKLMSQIKLLVTPVAGKDWAVPGLNMKFTWIKDLKFWVGTYEVTNGEYRKFKPEFKNNIYQGLGSMNGDRQPASLLSFRDAQNYCKWLTVKARERDELPKGFVYRLPTGSEWKKFATSGKMTTYPWGNNWPPAIKVNIGTKGVVKGSDPEWNDYKDDFPLTAPVEKSGKNPWGIYGCSGNVWEWTLDAEGSKRAVYGGSWNSMQKFPLCIELEGQNFAPETANNDDIGFRIILAPPVAN